MFVTDALLEYANNNKLILLGNIAFMALSPINDVLVPHLYGKLVDSIQSSDKTFQVWLAIVVGVMTAVQTGNMLLDLANARFLPDVKMFMRNKILERVMHNNEQDFTEIQTGKLLAFFDNTPDVLVYWFAAIKDYLLPYIVMIVVSSIYFAKQDAYLGLLFVALAVGIVYIFFAAPASCKHHSVKVSAMYNGLNEEVEDILRNVVSVYNNNQQASEIRRITAKNDAYRFKLMQAMTCIVKSKIVALPMLTLFLAAFVCRSRALIRSNAMKVSAFVSLFLIVTNMLVNLSWVVDVTRDATLDYGQLALLEATLAKKTLITRNGPPQDVPFADGIGLQNVTFGYGDSTVLRDVTVHFAPGDKAVLVGDIGSGKSTILRVLFKFVRPQSGDAYYRGRWHADSANVAQLRREVAYFPQTPSMFNRSIIDNVLYGTGATRDAAVRLMAKHDILDEFDDLDASAGKNGSHISGGQRQLVWTLRMILRRPKVMLFDEPTSSMDGATKRKLHALVSDYIAKEPLTIVIMVTHDPFLKAIATRTVRMQDLQGQ